MPLQRKLQLYCLRPKSQSSSHLHCTSFVKTQSWLGTHMLRKYKYWYQQQWSIDNGMHTPLLCAYYGAYHLPMLSVQGLIGTSGNWEESFWGKNIWNSLILKSVIHVLFLEEPVFRRPGLSSDHNECIERIGRYLSVRCPYTSAHPNTYWTKRFPIRSLTCWWFSHSGSKVKPHTLFISITIIIMKIYNLHVVPFFIVFDNMELISLNIIFNMSPAVFYFQLQAAI